MAYTAAGLTSRVQTRIRDTGFSGSTILELINDAINDVCNEYRFPFMQTSTTFTLAVNTADITNGSGLPSNFVQALNLTLTTAGYEKTLPFVTFDQIQEMYPDPSDTTANPANTPNVAYYANGTINVFPVPNSAYTVSLSYYKKPTELDADADIPELPSEFAELIVVGAAYRALQIKDNYDQAGVLQNKFDEILQKLAVKYNQIQVGSPIRMRINRRAVGPSNF